MPKVEYKDSEDVITTNNSIKVAEGIVKSKMPGQDDPKEKERMEKSAQKAVEYHLHDDDEEDEDTVETRKSVKTVEKRMKHRFFINARERKDYEASAAAGKISTKELDFAEDDDAEIGGKPSEAEKALNEEKKRQAQVDKNKDDVKKAEEGDKKDDKKDGAKKDGAKKEAAKEEGLPPIPELTPPF